MNTRNPHLLVFVSFAVLVLRATSSSKYRSDVEDVVGENESVAEGKRLSVVIRSDLKTNAIRHKPEAPNLESAMQMQGLMNVVDQRIQIKRDLQTK